MGASIPVLISLSIFVYVIGCGGRRTVMRNGALLDKVKNHGCRYTIKKFFLRGVG